MTSLRLAAFVAAPVVAWGLLLWSWVGGGGSW